MHNPLVSILIPLYNAEQYIEETITKALKQTYSNIELVIVDDHSTDNSLKIAQKYASERVHIYSNSKKGGNAARNYAFKKCNGEYIKFMDADDYMDDNMIEVQLKHLLAEKNPKNCVAFSPVIMRYADGHEQFQQQRNIDHDYVPGIELLIDIWRGKGWHCPHCHLMHRTLIEKAGPWDETVLKNQDGEFFSRIYAAAQKAISAKTVNAIWRQTNNGVSRQTSDKAWRSFFETHRRIAELILSYQDNKESKYICSRYICSSLFEHYPIPKDCIDAQKNFLKKHHIKLVVPNRRRYKLLSFVFGWEFTLKHFA